MIVFGKLSLCIAIGAVLFMWSTPGFAEPEPCPPGWCWVKVNPEKVIIFPTADVTLMLLKVMKKSGFLNLTVDGAPPNQAPVFRLISNSPFLNSKNVGTNFSIYVSMNKWPPAVHWIQYFRFSAWDKNGNLVKSESTPPKIDTKTRYPWYSALVKGKDGKYVAEEPNPIDHFKDGPNRPLPTPQVPHYQWTGRTFLVSANADTNTVTVYGGVQWGWEAWWGYNLPPDQIANGTTLWTLSNVQMKGFWGDATANGWLETGSCGKSCASDIQVQEGGYTYTFTGPVGGTGWTVPSEYPVICVLSPCTNTPLKAALSLYSTFTYPQALARFSLDDAGRVFPSYSGTLIGVLGTGPSECSATLC